MSESIAFWSRRLNDVACPRCRSIGTLFASLRKYGAEVHCAATSCEYEESYAEREA